MKLRSFLGKHSYGGMKSKKIEYCAHCKVDLSHVYSGQKGNRSRLYVFLRFLMKMLSQQLLQEEKCLFAENKSELSFLKYCATRQLLMVSSFFVFKMVAEDRK